MILYLKIGGTTFPAQTLGQILYTSPLMDTPRVGAPIPHAVGTLNSLPLVHSNRVHSNSNSIYLYLYTQRQLELNMRVQAKIPRRTI